MHKIRPGTRVHYVEYYENNESITLDGVSLASFCQSRAIDPTANTVFRRKRAILPKTAHACAE